MADSQPTTTNARNTSDLAFTKLTEDTVQLPRVSAPSTTGLREPDRMALAGAHSSPSSLILSVR